MSQLRTLGAASTTGRTPLRKCVIVGVGGAPGAPAVCFYAIADALFGRTEGERATALEAGACFVAAGAVWTAGFAPFCEAVVESATGARDAPAT